MLGSLEKALKELLNKQTRKGGVTETLGIDLGPSVQMANAHMVSTRPPLPSCLLDAYDHSERIE